jgi:hypothetical protein
MSKEEDDNSNDSGHFLDCKVAAKPSPKRMVKADFGKDFNAYTVHQVTGYMLQGLPASQQAAFDVLENLSCSSNNVTKTIVKSTVDHGNISIGMSQEIANIAIASCGEATPAAVQQMSAGFIA